MGKYHSKPNKDILSNKFMPNDQVIFMSINATRQVFSREVLSMKTIPNFSTIIS